MLLLLFLGTGYHLPRFGKGVKTVPHCALDWFYIGTYTILPKTYGCRQNVEKVLNYKEVSSVKTRRYHWAGDTLLVGAGVGSNPTRCWRLI